MVAVEHEHISERGKEVYCAGNGRSLFQVMLALEAMQEQIEWPGSLLYQSAHDWIMLTSLTSLGILEEWEILGKCVDIDIDLHELGAKIGIARNERYNSGAVILINYRPIGAHWITCSTFLRPHHFSRTFS